MPKHNDVFSLDDLKRLSKKQGQSPCVSLYMPTHKTGRELQENPLRFKNLVKKAAGYCQAQGIRANDTKTILDPHKKILENPLFWQKQSDGLAIFASPGIFECYRLPIKFAELVAVGPVFIFKPLFFYLSEYGKFYLLQLTKNRVKLYQGSIGSIAEIECPGLPRDMSSALWYKDYEKQLQLHHGNRSSESGAIFHGHGAGRDDLKLRIARYLRHIDKNLTKCVNDKNIPLVIASVEYFLPIWRQISAYPNIASQALSGNTENVREEKLREEAWKIAQDYYKSLKKKALKRCADLLETSRGTYIPKDIVKSAWEGKVAELFAPFGKQIWGKFNRQTGQIELHIKQEPDDIDILSLAVFFTYLRNGKVYVVDPSEMPRKNELAAILRK